MCVSESEVRVRSCFDQKRYICVYPCVLCYCVINLCNCVMCFGLFTLLFKVSAS